MEVKVLVELLQQCNPEATVEIEGCDCIGTPNAVVTLERFFSKGSYASSYKGNTDVIITRGNDEEVTVKKK